MIKLKAPSKNSTILRVVSWLNIQSGIGLEEYINSCPKNSCQLFWQSILWFLLLLNITVAVITTLSVVSLTAEILPFEVIGYFSDIFTCLGVILGMTFSIFLISIFFMIKSIVFWQILLAYLLLCAIFWVGFKYTKLFKGYRTKAPFLVIGWIGVCFVLGSTVEIIINYLMTNTKFHKILSKFKISCEDIE